LLLDDLSHRLDYGEGCLDEKPSFAGVAVVAVSSPADALGRRLDLAAIRRSHEGLVDPQTGLRFCGACHRGWPCLTARLVDAVLAAQKHRCSVDVPALTERAEVAEFERALAEVQAQLDTARASEAMSRTVLGSIAKAPCLTDLLGEEPSVGCDCPACIARAAVSAPLDLAVARIARLEAVVDAAQDVAQRVTRGGEAVARLREALAALV
jgi:hypothetical protein